MSVSRQPPPGDLSEPRARLQTQQVESPAGKEHAAVARTGSELENPAAGLQAGLADDVVHERRRIGRPRASVELRYFVEYEPLLTAGW